MLTRRQSPSSDLDIAIIGASAAGLMAGIFAGRQGGSAVRVAALDGAKTIGAKILVSGGGRCNVTHDAISPDDFAPANRNQVAKILRTFTVPQTVEFFRQLGVELKTEETGKLFPVTDKARTVLDALVRAAAAAGVEIRAASRVTAIRHADGLFHLDIPAGPITARSVILATGGLSLPKTGSDGGGYTLARSLGHTVTPTAPALVPLLLPPGHWLTRLSGLSMDVLLTLASSSGKVIHRQAGPLLLTHFGLSGPAAMDISRHWIAARRADPRVRLTANLLPGTTLEQADRRLVDASSQSPRAGVGTLLKPMFPQRLAAAMAEQAGLANDDQLSQAPRPHRRALARLLTELDLPVTGDRGYLFAEVTAGGVPLDEVDLATMGSRRTPGLYLCGELLDVDGRIGGYNFQWAWCTGRLAGIAAASAVPTG